MANKTNEGIKRIALIGLVVICAWLVYRNLIVPALPGGATPASEPGVRQDDLLRSPSPRTVADAGRRNRAMNQQELAGLDPSLRLDLLEKLREVKYEGSARNIFQFYTPPPPKPVASALLPTANKPQPTPPPPPSAPFKFYGVASRPGSAEKKAFLTGGDDIFVGQEGDIIDKNYRITRIGVNSIELEDTRTKQRSQLALVAE
jgi:hypothetical protein